LVPPRVRAPFPVLMRVKKTDLRCAAATPELHGEFETRLPLHASQPAPPRKLRQIQLGTNKITGVILRTLLPASVVTGRGSIVPPGGVPMVRADLVGRESEMASLAGWLQAAIDGHPGLVLCRGEPGIASTLPRLRLREHFEKG
jgi:hypothetical protein